jgi:hypothetical protein
MRSAAAIVFAALIVAGCDITDRSYSDLMGGVRGLDQLKMDGATCDMALQQSPAGQPAAAGSNAGLTLSNVGTRMIEQDNFLDSCMLSRGWERK